MTLMRIDLHSHLLPGVDDGCRNLEESLTCIRMLLRHGYGGTVCTPHLLPNQPHLVPEVVAELTSELAEAVAKAGLEYRLWPGGELRLTRDTVRILDRSGVPTLGDGRTVLFDLWVPRWPRWGTRAVDHLLDHGYQPVMAHPERTARDTAFLKRIDRLCERGVLLQGNLKSLTPATAAQDPFTYETAMRNLRDGRYAALALDMHRPETLPARLDGLAAAEAVVGATELAELVEHTPRRWLEIG